MAKLRLGPIPDDRPIRITITVSAALHARLGAYAAALAAETGQRVEPVKMIPHMVERFMAADRAFAHRRREPNPQRRDPSEPPSPSRTSSDASKRSGGEG
jgi:hypothetical protein